MDANTVDPYFGIPFSREKYRGESYACTCCGDAAVVLWW